MGKIYRLFYTAAILLLFSFGKYLYAQDSVNSTLFPNLKLHFDHYTTENGLSQNSIYTILQDKKGFLWFGTQGGVNRFNGHDFKIFSHNAFDTSSIPHSYINKIYEDSKARIWICTEGGLSLFNPLTESFTNFLHSNNNSRSIIDNFVWDIFEDNNGTIWVGTSQGLSLFDPQSKTFKLVDLSPSGYKKNKPINACNIFQDNNGIIWISTRGYGIFSIQKSGNAGMTDSNFIIKNYKAGNNDARAVIENPAGNIYASIFGSGLFEFDKDKNKFINNLIVFSDPTLKHPELIKTIFINPSSPNLLWMGTEEDGLIITDTKRNTYVKINNDPKYIGSLSGNMVFSFLKDRSGLIWVGSNQGINLVNLNANKFKHIQATKNNIQGLSSNTIGKIIEDKDGIIWVGTDGGGVNKYDRHSNKFTHYRFRKSNTSSVSSDRAMIVFEDSKNNIWVGTYGGGLNKFNRSTNKFEPRINNISNPINLCSNYITSIVEDKLGYFWIGTTTGGINRFNPITNEYKCFLNNPDDSQSLSDNHVWILYFDSNDVLWAGTRNGGLNEMTDPDKGIFRRYLHDESNPGSLIDNTVFAIYEDSNLNFWVGTNSGLTKLNRRNGKFVNFSSSVLPPQYGAAGILEDDHNQIWLLAGNEIIRYKADTGEIKYFDNENGMMIKDLRIWSCYKNIAGEMFFGGANGFTIFHPDSLKDNVFIPPVVIDKLERFNEDDNSGYPIEEKGISHKKNIELSYKDNIFSISFAALNYLNPGKNKYAYKLEGFNKEWINIGSQQKVTFTNIDPGSYNFVVKGSNDDGVWNETGASLQIEIIPPFWKTLWFRSGIILTLVLIIGTSIRNKFNEIERHHKEQETFARQLIETEELERQRIANELHDSLGQNLLVIKNSLLVKQQQEHIDGRSLADTSDLVSQTIQEVRSISHNLRPHLLDQLGLTKTIKSLAKQVNESYDIKINFQIDDLKDALDAKAEINFFRIMQECFNNIIKHSGASKADIIIKRNPNSLYVSIKDNGKGMNVEEMKRNEEFGNGFGLYGIKKRAHVFAWKYEMSSAINKGTEIKITIPLKKES